MNRVLRVAAASGLSLATAAALAACSSTAVVPQANGGQSQSALRESAATAQAVPRFTVIPRTVIPQAQPATGGMPLWNGSFKYNGETYNYQMIGENPATSNKTTTIPVVLIPVKIKAGSKSFDPNKSKAPNGQTITENTVNSPIYQKGIDFVQGGTDLGNTQYIDAFQRGNFWSLVSTNTNYHTLLGQPKIEKEVTITGASTGNPFGNLTVAEIDINAVDNVVQETISKLKVPKGTLPVFLLYDTYMTSGGCCIGGYHDITNNGANTYAVASYISKPGDFSQDVSALSHEIGEWMDDPGYNGFTPACNGGILEVGDPLEGTSNYGGYPYKLNKFTYNLQDLVWLRYFGAPSDTSANSWWSFQNYPFKNVCQNGG